MLAENVPKYLEVKEKRAHGTFYPVEKISETILPQGFWSAVQDKDYSGSNNSTLSYHLDEHVEVLRDYGYLNALNNPSWNFFIDLMAIEGIFICVRPQSLPESFIGIIDYNLKRSREQKKIRQRTTYKNRMLPH